MDYIKELANQVKTSNQAYWEKCLRKWLVATVACAIEPGIVNQTVLILKGPQGCGKSTFLEGLMPTILKDYYYGGALDPNNKDAVVNLAECLIINLDELESLTKYKEAALKEIITKNAIRIRRPYATHAENLYRRASFVGSVNTNQILSDSTGSRRFLIHEVASVNYQHTVDMDKVWKQAYDLYLSGFIFHFNQAEIKDINCRNDAFEIVKPEEELLLARFKHGDSQKYGALSMTTTDILKVLHNDRLPGNSRSEAIKLGLALAKHEFPYIMVGKVRKYIVQRVSCDDDFSISLKGDTNA